jgi:nicotinamidase-related amidase
MPGATSKSPASSTTPRLAHAALLVIDVQKAIDAAYHAAAGPRNNAQAESNIARLLAVWRRAKRPIIHIRHDSVSPASAYRPDQPGNEFKDEVAPGPGETIVAKRTNSAFIGTGLERGLREASIDTIVVTGVSTNNSVEARCAWRETLDSGHTSSKMHVSPLRAATFTGVSGPRTRFIPCRWPTLMANTAP